MDLIDVKADALALIQNLLSTKDNTFIGGILVAVLVVLITISKWQTLCPIWFEF